MDNNTRKLIEGKELTEEEKEALKRQWNNTIALLYGGETKLKQKAISQHCHRIMRVHQR